MGNGVSGKKEEHPAAGHRQRLKEKFVKAGAEAFHDYELIELLLTYAIPRRDVKPASKELIRTFKGIRGVFDASIDELKAVKGVGENAAVLFKLIKDTIGVYLLERAKSVDVVRSAADLVKYLDSVLSGERVEKFLAVYLNSKNEILAVETLHEGTIDQTVVYPRKAIEGAFRHNARSVIFVHNHPSGDPTPSVRDKDLTKNLLSAAESVDIIVHDHIIIGKKGFVSGRELGWMRGK
ncbi:MAG: DNA repair protein RadC [Deltaproteobacteria bacterium]|nr:DNA repair protein RadC [Deltaproteobacteria bacterium]